jgi:hypothetical protein
MSSYFLVSEMFLTTLYGMYTFGGFGYFGYLRLIVFLLGLIGNLFFSIAYWNFANMWLRAGDDANIILTSEILPSRDFPLIEETCMPKLSGKAGVYNIVGYIGAFFIVITYCLCIIDLSGDILLGFYTLFTLISSTLIVVSLFYISSKVN